MYISGKHTGRPTVVAVSAGQPSATHPLLYVWDRFSGRRFLIDTGAEISVLSPSANDRNSHSNVLLTAANGTSIRTFGQRSVPLKFSTRQFTWVFHIADIPQSIIGADFLRAHNLFVDVRGRRLIDAQTFASVPCGHVFGHVPHLNALCTVNNEYAKLLAEFPGITTPTFGTPTTKHGVEHHIPTEGPPVHARARRLPPDKLALAKAEFRKKEELGIIRRSDSAWASPLHMAPKKSGGW